MDISRRNLRLRFAEGPPLPAEALQVEEAIGEVPTYRVRYRQETRALEALLGQKVTVLPPEADLPDGTPARPRVGIVTAAERCGTERVEARADGQGEVELTLRPALALLGCSVRCRVYQNRSSIDILKDLLALNGLRHAKLQVAATPPRRVFCLQYREDDLSFIRRLLAEDGIAFYYGDADDPEVLILHDSARPYPHSAPGPLRLGDGTLPDPGRTRAVVRRRSTAGPARVALTGYDVARAAQTATGAETVQDIPAFQATSVTLPVLAPSGDLTADALRRLARDRATRGNRLTGTMQHPGPVLGQGLDVASTDPDLAGDYVLSSFVSHTEAGGLSRVQFVACPRRGAFVPPQRPRPVVPGVQTAVVVGADPGQPAQDAEGRVKVRFAWDTSGDTRDTSCWIRVATPLAGQGYGAAFTPRAGQEVLVAFLDGDPDAPVIAGSLPNGKHTHPLAAAGSTRSGLSTGLGPAPTNALEFDDRDGAERMTLRAARDFALEVPANVTAAVGGTETRSVAKAAEHAYDQGLTVQVAQAAAWSAQEITLSAERKLVLTVGSSVLELTPSGITIKGTTVAIEATTLTASGSAKIALSGGTGSVEASGPLTLKGLQLTAEGSAMTTVKAGAMLTVQASGMTTVKGALVQIN